MWKRKQKIGAEAAANNHKLMELEVRTNLFLLSGRRSMLDDKEMLAKLGKKIGDELSKLTRGVKMGFGTFVDKPVMPYVSIAGIAKLEALVEPRN